MTSLTEPASEPLLEDTPPSRRPTGYGCLAVLVAFAVLAGGAFYAFNAGLDALKNRFDSTAEDYSGKGSGSVLVQVEEGDAASDIASSLAAKNVVKSEEAFTDAAEADPDSRGIQVGVYEMNKRMSAESALAVLVDPDNVIQSTVAFPEGWSVDQILRQLAAKTDFSRASFEKALRPPARIGLPDYAGGNPEGYLFPATYQISPDAGPRRILAMMVTRYDQAASKFGLEARAKRLGVSPHDVMTVASLIQAEARFNSDFAKVSRVIYNRLDDDMALQFDSTVHYAVGKDGGVGTSDEERAFDSPYNTYKYPGLPPTPISSPGERAIEAALKPADGPWRYFVTTNPDTGKTKFAKSYDDHLENKAEFDAWCQQSDSC
ncbi:MAG: endolytic transglycosylase MltG [Actinomycetota bacterium]|nr:endolytic transglycosylase MltG [Actinomycetota bacterium]